MSSAVRLEDVYRTYGAGDSEVRALDGVNVEFPEATFTAVMGPSGSGKSTLLQCAAGLDRPDTGRVVVAETELTGRNETSLTRFRRRHIGFVFQSFNLVSSLTAAENVALPLRLAGRRAPDGEIRRALSSVGLADRLGHRPGQLSGGQQQRVAIARALVVKPSVLFADEPTGALDSNRGREVLALLRGLVDELGQTVIMVTHDPVAAFRADRVVFLRDGRIDGDLVRPTADAVAARMTSLEAE
ncbi:MULTISPECIES: ABC transporter ATP-binding protein [Amycolatopsis]|uniref:ABC transporter ATP-binding protein n=1 Tax=Amycolatopsis albidoflavus TaxID=102226 RepID=A0ABW5I8U6_9PSEU